MAHVAFKWYGQQCQDDAKRAVGMGIKAGLIFLTGAFKQTLSIPAPRRRVKSAKGVIYYVATKKATRGAPPRKLSGRLRAGQQWEMDEVGMVGRAGTNVIYGKRLVKQGHEWMRRTTALVQNELAMIIGTNAQQFKGT